jgi:hypothetical protein
MKTQKSTINDHESAKLWEQFWDFWTQITKFRNSRINFHQ